MSCRHDLANGTCLRCYLSTGNNEPGPEESYDSVWYGPGAIPAARSRLCAMCGCVPNPTMRVESDLAPCSKCVNATQYTVLGVALPRETSTFEQYWATTGPWPNNILGTAFKELAQKVWSDQWWSGES